MKELTALRSGGLHLRDARHREDGIRISLIPSIAVFPLLQHSGIPAECVVSVGDRVEEGMVIARDSSELSLPVHSSIPGVVTAIRSVRLPNGQRSDGVVVRLEGEFGRPKREAEASADHKELSRDALLELLRERGLVSLDSDAAPLHVHWRLPKGKRVGLLLVSTVSEEPYVSVEEHLATSRPDALAQGLGLAIRILDPSSVMLVSNESVPEGGRSELAGMAEEVARDAGKTFSVKFVGTEHLGGGRRKLVRTVTEERVVPGSSLIDSGVMVTNASTLVAVHDGIVGGKPLIERYVTVSGGAVKEPATLRVRIGTRIGDLIDECGGLRELPNRIVCGGPLTGSAVYDLETPVIKNTEAVIALSNRETSHAVRLPCINCGKCLSVCPEGLDPSKLVKAVEHARYSNAVSLGLFDCSECGECGLACPSHIPLLEAIRGGKRLARRAGHLR